MKSNIFKFWLIAGAIMLSTLRISAQSQIFYPTKVIHALKHDTSLPLSELIATAAALEIPVGTPREMRRHDIPESNILGQSVLDTDPVAQEQFGMLPLVQDIIINLDGINNLCNCYPPDPNGDIGPQHYIQTVNTHFAIYNRLGDLLQGPALLSTLWNGFPGPWSGHNDGDPIVLYDHLADRWMVTQFAIISGAPDYELVAISQTSNPLGSWHRYAFEFADLPDYPKLAVWPDAYYMTISRFNDAGTTYLGMAAVALERDAMLAGNSAQMLLFTNFTDHSAGRGLLPSDLDGTTPPSGTPNYFAYVVDGATQGGSDRLGIYELNVNWANLSGSTFTGPTLLMPAAFNRMCVGTRNCIPQQGTAQGLDILGDRLMYRLQYRNFGNYQAMVANHSVDAGGGRAGIRWYEFRNTGSGWSIHQQGTYAPADGKHRWMGSIAMDQYGNIALGYTVSSNSMYPSIRYTGRFSYDPGGQMTVLETEIKAGGGAQTGSASRWGDYSMMAVDPTDGVTFWFTHEYLQTTGAAPWRTRIAAFQLASEIPVTVDQQLQSGVSVDSIGRWEGGPAFTPYSVPQPYDFTIGSTEVLRGAHKIISGQKYNKWDVSDDVVNHHEFIINQDADLLTSLFNFTHSGITLQNNLLNAPGLNPDDDVIAFKDPWLIDYLDPNYENNKRNQGMSAPFKSRLAPFYPNYATSYNGDIYLGVFLNEGGNEPNPLPPYYSVQGVDGQQATANGKAVTWDWESWSYNPSEIFMWNPNSNPAAVKFLSANATLTANLKGRRTSDTPQATANDNGFHLAAGITYPYLVPQLVYTDRGNIYHSKATQIVGGGVSWGKDKLIAQSQANSIYSAPALSPLQTYTDIEPFNTPITERTVIAYDQYDPVARSYKVAGGVLTGPPSNPFVPFTSSPFTPASYPRHPSAAGYYHIFNGDQRIAIALAGMVAPLGIESSPGIAVWFTKNNSTHTITTNSSADFPALDCRKRIESIQNPHYFLAWQQNDGIHYREFEDQNNSLVFSGSEILLSAGHPYLFDHRLPALSADLFKNYVLHYKDTVMVVWQALEQHIPDENPGLFSGGESSGCPASPDAPVLCFKEKKWNTWSPLYIFQTPNYCDRRPVVCSWPVGSSRDCLIAYEHLEGKVYYVKRSGGNWQAPLSLTADGAHPAATTLAGTPQLLYSEFQQSPYRLVHIEQVLPEEGPEELPPHSRRVSFRLRESLAGGQQLPIDGDITFEIGDPQWITAGGSQPVKPLYEDSLITPGNAFHFNAISVAQAGERLIVPVQIVGRNLKRVSPIGNNPLPLPLLRLRLKDGNTGQILQTVHTFQSTILGNDSTRYIAITDTFEIELSALVNRRIQVEGATFFNPNPERGATLEPGKGRPQIAEVYDLREESSQARLAGKVPAAANAGAPGQFSLSQNYPNPFNPATTIEFQLPQNSHANLKIYDIQGRLVRTLLDQEMEAGSHRVTWDGRDERGDAAASGVYLFHFVAGNFQQTRKMVLMR